MVAHSSRAEIRFCTPGPRSRALFLLSHSAQTHLKDRASRAILRIESGVLIAWNICYDWLPEHLTFPPLVSGVSGRLSVNTFLSDGVAPEEIADEFASFNCIHGMMVAMPGLIVMQAAAREPERIESIVALSACVVGLPHLTRHTFVSSIAPRLWKSGSGCPIPTAGYS